MKKIWLMIAFLCGAQISFARPLTDHDFQNIFANYHACFLLYDLNQHQLVASYNPEHRCTERLPPDSTFKVALSLMGFNQGIMTQRTDFIWDGQTREIPEWNQDQTATTWLQYSVLWVSQRITQQLGLTRIQHYLAGFNYGNQDFSGDVGLNNGLTHAWLSSSLKISADEQLNFLKAFALHELPLTPKAFEYTHQNMYLGDLENGAKIFAKTGSGRHGRNERLPHPSKLRDGWFIGFVETEQNNYVFVVNITDKKPLSTDKNYGVPALKPYGSEVAKAAGLQLLNQYFKAG